MPEVLAWLQKIAPHIVCAKCGAPVERVDLQRSPILESWLFDFRCHGKKQHLRVSYLLLKVGEIGSYTAFASKPKKSPAPGADESTPSSANSLQA